LVNLDYAVNAFADSALVSAGRPVNGTFSLRASASAAAPAAATAGAAAVVATPAVIGAAPAPTGTNQPETVAVLPCRTFTFQPNSTGLTAESQRLLDVCVLPALRQRANIALIVRGSAAWPTGGDYTEESVRLFGASRANAIVDYLVAQGVERKRFIVEGVAPPPERRAITDALKLAADRYVEMTLIIGGL
jgi:outer membrane protein OmpA-like peptidoglycan-associated protein